MRATRRGSARARGRLPPSPPGQVGMSLQPAHPNCCQQLQGRLPALAGGPKHTQELGGEQAAPPCRAGSSQASSEAAPAPPPAGQPLSSHCAQLSGSTPEWETLTQGSWHPPVSMMAALARHEVMVPPHLTAFSPQSPAPSHQCCRLGGPRRGGELILPGCRPHPFPRGGASCSLKGLQKSIPSNSGLRHRLFLLLSSQPQ